MSDKISKSVSSDSPRQLIEALIELLREKNVSPSNLGILLGRLEWSLNKCFALRTDDCAYEDAIERAPWLTADAERLHQERASLRRSLHAICRVANQAGGSTESLTRRFHEFTELFLEHEAAEQNFLEAAFPGPAWTEQA